MPAAMTLRGIAILLGLAVAAPAVAEDLQVYAHESPPYDMLVNGEPAGLEVELFRALAHRAGQTYRLEMVPWLRAQFEAEDKPDVGQLGIVRSPKREPLYNWVGRMFESDYVVVTRKAARPAPQTAAELQGMTVGLLRGSAVNQLLQAVPGVTVVDQPTYVTNARMLAGDRLDAWAGGRLIIRWAYREAGYDPADLDEGLILGRSSAYFVLSKSTPAEVVARWASAYRAARDEGDFSAIYAKYGMTPPEDDQPGTAKPAL